MLDRRTLLTGMMALPALGAPVAWAAVPVAQDFVVRRNGAVIGHHRLRFREEGSRLVVEIDIELEVKLAFLTLYRYRHTNREVWEGDRLLGFASRTDDNGTAHAVTARRVGERLLAAGGAGSIEVPGDTPPTTYRHRRFLDHDRWIDSQSGRLVSGTVTPKGREPVEVWDKLLEAERFAVSGDLAMDLWYAGDLWVGLAFAGPDGSAIDCRLERGGPVRLAAAR
jgi:hypothetical protein